MGILLRTISVTIILGSYFLAPGGMAAEQVFKKRSADGTVVFSDAPLNNSGQRLAYTSNFGRAPATASCTGQTPASLRVRRDALEAQFSEAALITGVDLSLLHAVARVESCFDPQAKSHAGAEGVMQLMPPTAAAMGVSNSFNARSNIRMSETLFSV